MEEQMGSRRDMGKVAEKEKDKKEGKEETEKERSLANLRTNQPNHTKPCSESQQICAKN